LFDLGSRSSRLTAAQSQGDDLYLYDKPPKPPAMPCRWFLICGYRIAGRAGPTRPRRTGATNQRKGSRITLQGYLSSKTTSLLFKDCLASEALSLFKGCLKAKGAAAEGPFAGGDENQSAAVRPRSSDSQPIHSDSWAGTPLLGQALRDFLAKHPATRPVRRATAKVTRGTRRP
jgi:hypothetical protein